MICALDTNILIYAEGLNGEAMQARARSVLKSLSDRACIPLQVAWELYTVLIRRAGRSPEAARAAAHLWAQRYPLLESSAGQALAPLDLACEHRLSVWDAVVMAAAQAGGCRVLLSEDLQHGFTWRGVTVVNPFATPAHPLLRELSA